MAYEEGIIFNAIWFWIIGGSHLFCLAEVEVENTTNTSNTDEIAQDMCMENFDDDNHDGPRTTVSGKKNKKIFLEMVQKF
jgi:hypothetical protein